MKWRRLIASPVRVFPVIYRVWIRPREGLQNGADVDVHIGSLAISFMEKLETGAVQTTVISFAGDSTHSRHTLFSDKDLVPSQYYGRCTKE
jgi:hypothetical protein